MKALLIRHGEAGAHSRTNDESVFVGSRSDMGLVPAGEQTAQKVATEVAASNLDMIFTSSLKRSIQTGNIIAKKIFDLTGNKISRIEISELDEVDFGEFSGLTRKEALNLFPGEARFFVEGQMERWAFPGGESYQDVAKRIDVGLEKIKSSGSRSVLIVGHAVINRIIFHKLGMKKLAEDIDYPHDRIVEVEL